MKQTSHKARLILGTSILVAAVSLSGCATLEGAWGNLKSGNVTRPDEMSKALYVPEPAQMYDVLSEAEDYTAQTMPSLIMDGQMKPMPIDVDLFDSGPSLSGFQAVSYANDAAIVKPTTDNYLNAIQLYPYTPGSLYQVYTSPTQVTDIALEKGEGLITVSAGDTERWTVGDTVSGSGVNEQVHILVKPMAANLSTNAIITSTRRTYYLDLKSFADTYMAAVSWRYPHQAIRNMRKTAPATDLVTKASFERVDAGLNADDLRFDYVIKGDTPHWRPTRVFDDGSKVFIEFPEGLAVSEAPPLFVTDGTGTISKLVNYRVRDGYYVVDRLFDAAELRLGEKDQTVVRIERQS
ncbi:P-type conjugative transfer protein TrbG [Hellea balneolensis]|uniref:P-type conjugative transfer protein TrbG n=1 Tax=Hellea balneolensis TaxID=287478 RepID=UPI000684BB0D|nr:P-type conjugative transfer protein TrbG [Hellea balneolensis]